MTAPSSEYLNVSRETFERLSTYVALLEKWNPKINLVAKSTLDDVWDRHIVDSLQVLDASAGLCGHWLDIGTGGGLPGLIIALCTPENVEKVSLIESDQRKAVFLRTVLRETDSQAKVFADRIEAVAPQNADILSARALAPLPQLLEFACRHLAPSGTALFSKGVTWEKELDIAQKAFSFRCEAIKSSTQQGAVILRISEISRV
ncbi:MULTISPECIES: 16S rRNA (guanine(527)-N(7))-methyltransferase RsmG [unclassified Marinovum]